MHTIKAIDQEVLDYLNWLYEKGDDDDREEYDAMIRKIFPGIPEQEYHLGTGERVIIYFEDGSGGQERKLEVQIDGRVLKSKNRDGSGWIWDSGEAAQEVTGSQG